MPTVKGVLHKYKEGQNIFRREAVTCLVLRIEQLEKYIASKQSAQADGEPKTIEEAITKARDAHDWAQVSLLETVRDMRDLQ